MTDGLAATRAWPRRAEALVGWAVLTARLVGVAATAVATLVALVLVVVVIGVWLYPAGLRALRAQAGGVAASHAHRTGVELRVPTLSERAAGGVAGAARHTFALLADAEAWRLLRWAVVDACTSIGPALVFVPLGLVAWGVEGVVVMPALYLAFGITPTEWYAFIPVWSPQLLPAAALLGAAFIVAGVATGPWWLRLHGRWAAALLGSATARLRERVDALTASRAEARGDAAAELRRLEREVHDGTQSQLVAIGLTLGAAEALMATDPERARALIAKARDDSTAALAELRDLMRGIRPPVLADRGLAAALESLAIDASTRITTRIDLPVALDPALETAVYFASRELITNAIKHARAAGVVVEATAGGGVLAVTVADDGCGGAAVLPGRGLDGVRRRLAAFDGTLAIASPEGGPTTARIEVPCGS